MKRFITIIAAVLVSLTAFAQDKITWTHHCELQKDNEYRVIFTGKIAKGYHTYTLTDEFSATEFMDMEVEGGELVGKPYEIGKPKQEMEDGELVEHYYDEIIIAQNVRLTAPEAKFAGTILSNVCTGGACSANWYNFTVTVLPENAVMPIIDEVEDTEPIKTKPATEAPAVETQIVVPPVVEDHTDETPVVTKEQDVVEEQTVVETQIENTTVIGSKATKVQALLENDNAHLTFVQNKLRESGVEIASQNQMSDNSIWSWILIAFLSGLAMIITPCVFPMVPMTVSFFMKGSENAGAGRFKAAMYGLFIVLISTVPIAILSACGVLVNFNEIATHWFPNILFFIIFMIFAISFFGAFEITLPQSLVNKSDQNSDKKGLIGVFFMAFTLVLVSFSCTGPIVGTVLLESVTNSGSSLIPVIVMLVFSIAFAIPFTLFAFFPTLLKKFKKSGGGWLNSVKVVFGFIEIALGLKFLSIPDQTYHWGLLSREVYLAIWIVVFSLLGLYLLGKIRFAHDEPVEHLSVPRLGLAIVVFSFVVYMIPGLTGAPLKALAGYLPPMETKLTIYKDFEEGLIKAKEENKPIFIDVTGYGCTNCREMEEKVWCDSEVEELMKEYGVIALYVDDKEKLPESKWIKNIETGEYLKRKGEANSYIAKELYETMSQPTYVLLKPNGEILVPEAQFYDTDVDNFKNFLNRGLKEFKKIK